jgi:hypothetical protein
MNQKEILKKYGEYHIVALVIKKLKREPDKLLLIPIK